MEISLVSIINHSFASAKPAPRITTTLANPAGIVPQAAELTGIAVAQDGIAKGVVSRRYNE